MLPLLSACSQLTTPSQPEPDGHTLNETQLHADIRELASDRYQGRLPTTEGETLTLAYLQSRFEQMGLKPGNGDSYLQPVPMRRLKTTGAKLTIDGQPQRYLFDMVLNSFSDAPTVNLSASELVFVGYGINAPEYQWNDYAGLDVKGKTVVMLVNDPGFASEDPALFRGTTMTYYGRWDYKFAEAGRQGAAAALIIHDTRPASYPWMVVQNSWTGPQLDLANSQDPHPMLEGWLTKDAARAVLARAGEDLDTLTAQATEQPMHRRLGLTVDAALNQTIDFATSHNVVALLPGIEAAEEEVIYTAHWDHIGAQGEEIYNGAMDNATGIAALLALADAFSQGPQPRRSVRFLAVTGEEQGLLGSRYYAANPITPLGQVAGVFNVDSTNIYGRTRDYTLVGQGQSELEQLLIDATTEQGRHISPEARPGAGSYYRSDHFSFVRQGVPSVYARGGQIPWDDATAQYKSAMQARVKGCYHGPCDTYHPDWDLSGTLQDISVYLEAGRALAEGESWPGFLPGSEFFPLRPAGDAAP
ncbi:M28 family metallopeptidase [Ferrimonas gelatinilytica]|uniref:M28 family metallopeptidase n=1 Tax=Ferrimonas gelatinilytica TaxID=1255257 RepID=A0ABP9RYL8_9GAMM